MVRKNETVTHREAMIGDIPVLEAYANEGAGMPLVILSHGFMGKKESMNSFGFMDALARRGCLAVALDNRLHGRRSGPSFRVMAIKSLGRVDIIEVRKAIKGTADDIQTLVGSYIAGGRADAGRICVAGVSMGGFAAYRAVVIDSHIRVAMPLISSPYWDDIPGDIPIAAEEDRNRDLTVYAAEYSPGNQPDRFFPCALLMQAGDCDRHFNVGRLREFYGNLSGYYSAEPDRLKLIVYPGLGHTVNEEMVRTALGWVERYL